jgi:hypothetical protein
MMDLYRHEDRMPEMGDRARCLDLIGADIAQARALIQTQEILISTCASKGLSTEQEQKLLGLMQANLERIAALYAQIRDEMVERQSDQ